MQPGCSPVVVTGASGFVGRHLCAALEAEGHVLHRVQRQGDGAGVWAAGDLAQSDIPDAALQGAGALIHLAARLPGQAGDPEGSETEQMARRVARQARAHGLGRVIVLSSVAARLQARAYGAQKLAAERAFLEELPPETGLIFLRPPVIYGAGAKGSFGMLSGAIRRGLPLPLAGAQAPRAYLAQGNLAALCAHLLAASDAQWAEGRGLGFEPHDGYGHDGPGVSGRDLARMLGQAQGRPARLFYLPPALLRALGRMAGKSDQVAALFEPLECRETPSLEQVFGWRPQHRMPASLAQMFPQNMTSK